MSIEGATNAEGFQGYLREILIFVPRPAISFMDKFGAHKNDPTLALIRQVGVGVRFLPAYSPALNLIGDDVEQTEGSPSQGSGAQLPCSVQGCRPRFSSTSVP